MNRFALNLILALLWGAVSQSFTLANLTIGFLLGILVLYISEKALGTTSYLLRLWAIVKITGFFLWALLTSSIRVAWEVITPRSHMSPGVIGVPLENLSDEEITLMANLISLTPGTLSLDVSDDKSRLYVHAMYADDVEALRHELKYDFERRVKKVTQS